MEVIVRISVCSGDGNDACRAFPAAGTTVRVLDEVDHTVGRGKAGDHGVFTLRVRPGVYSAKTRIAVGNLTLTGESSPLQVDKGGLVSFDIVLDPSLTGTPLR